MLKSGEIRSLTGLRGIAAFLVVMFHYRLHHEGSIYVRQFFSHGYLWVDMFFCLSGFVLSLGYGKRFEPGITISTYRRFVLDRIARIFPLAWFITIVAFVCLHCGISELDTSATDQWSAFVPNMLLIQSWGFCRSIVLPAWSLSTEWAVSLCFPILVLGVLQGGSRHAVAAGALSVLALGWLALLPADITGVVRHHGPLDETLGTNYAPLLRCAADFTLGMASFRVLRAPGVYQRVTRGWVSIASILLLGVLFVLPGTDFCIVLVFPVLIASLTSSSVVASRVLGSAPLRYLGQISYSLYLTHTVVIAVFKDRALALGTQLHVPAIATVSHMATLGLCLVCSALSYRFIEIPGRDLLRNTFSLRRVPVGAEPSAP